MQTTKIMLAVLATFILTWMAVTFIGFMCSTNVTFKEVATHSGTIMFMLIFGWVPSIIVGMDVDQYLTSKS